MISCTFYINNNQNNTEILVLNDILNRFSLLNKHFLLVQKKLSYDAINMASYKQCHLINFSFLRGIPSGIDDFDCYFSKNALPPEVSD